MRHNINLLVFLCSLYGFSQLYVSEGTLISLMTPETILTSQESLNQIEAPIIGKGVLYLNKFSTQRLISTQPFLTLPTLQIANAKFVALETALNMQHQLVIETGVLTLCHDVLLLNKAHLILGERVRIQTPTGQLIYKTQFETSNPLAETPLVTQLKYTRPEWSQKQSSAVLTDTSQSNFGYLASTHYIVYVNNFTPPPEVS